MTVKLTSTSANAISAADSSYFNEDYTKQARAVLAAIDKAGFQLVPKEFPSDTWVAAANAMRTGRVKPEDHVKNVYETVLKVAQAR